MRRTLQLLALLFPVVAFAQAKSPVAVARGTVIDARGVALAGAIVLSDEVPSLATQSDASGHFAFARVPAGTWTFIARLAGFAPETLDVAVADGDTATFRFVMQRSLATLPGVKVVADPKPALFEEMEQRSKRRGGGAQFVSREQIEKWQPRTVSDILRRVMGIRVVDSLGVPLVVSARGDKSGFKATSPCVLRTGVDGNLQDPMLGVNVVQPIEVHAVEIFAGPATIPPEYAGSRRESWCGLVMIWTRRGR